ATSHNTYEAPGVKGAHVPKGRRSAAPASLSLVLGSRLRFSIRLRSGLRTKHVSRLPRRLETHRNPRIRPIQRETGSPLRASSYLRARLRGGATGTRGYVLRDLRSGRPINRDSLPDVWCSGLSVACSRHMPFGGRVRVSSVLDGPSYTPGSPTPQVQVVNRKRSGSKARFCFSMK